MDLIKYTRNYFKTQSYSVQLKMQIHDFNKLDFINTNAYKYFRNKRVQCMFSDNIEISALRQTHVPVQSYFRIIDQLWGVIHMLIVKLVNNK